jgi:glycosyltransferase involved in cell wall biosynthesis
MHIVHVLTRLLRAGSEENTIATCRWQLAQGHRVTLIHGQEAHPVWDNDLPQSLRRIRIPELVHPLRPDLDMRALRSLKTHYSRLEPDVVHTHQSKAGILGRLAARAVPDATVVHGIHILPFAQVDPMRRAIYIAAEKMAARNTDLFIAVSDALGTAYARLGIACDVRTVRSGMDLSRFRHAALPADWRSLLNIESGQRRPPVAVMLAAFEPRKGHMAFLSAFAKVAHRAPDLKILFAGDGPELPRACALARELGLDDQVIFAGHRNDPEALLSMADISVLTSVREGLPRVAVQSIAAGRPMLVQDLPGISEVITDGVNGRIFPTGDPAPLVQALADLAGDRAELGRLRRGAEAHDVSDWSLDALGARTTALYRSVGKTEDRRAA